MKNVFCVVFGGLVLSGCVDVRPVPTQEKCVKPSPSIVKQVSPEVVATPSDGRLVVRASEIKSALRVRVSISGSNDVERQIAGFLSDRLQETLADARFRVVKTGAAEVELTGSAVCNGAISRGTRISARGSAVLSIWSKDRKGEKTGRSGQVLVAKRQFDARGESAQNEVEVLSELAKALAASAQKWLVDRACRSTEGLALCEITIRSAKRGMPLAADYPARFVKESLASSGILDCRVVERGEADVLRATVLYDRQVVKEGVLNRLCAIPSLNLRK